MKPKFLKKLLKHKKSHTNKDEAYLDWGQQWETKRKEKYNDPATELKSVGL